MLNFCGYEITTTYRHSQDVRELVSFSLSEAVPCVCDKNYWHHKLSLRVDQLLKRLLGRRDWHPSPNKHAIDVKQQAKPWLWLQKDKNGTS